MKISFPDSEYPFLIRTDFSDDAAWERIKSKITSPDNEYEAVITFVDEKRFGNLAVEHLPRFENEQDKHDFVFIADSLSMHSEEHTILCVDLDDNYGQSFRVIPSMLWAVANNLFITNADFSDFVSGLDADGIFRRF